MIDSAIEAGAPTVASQRDSVVQSLPTTSTHGHEHCMLVSASRAARLEARPLTLVQLPFVATPIAAALAVRGPHGSALYRTAPKTSPPA